MKQLIKSLILIMLTSSLFIGCSDEDGVDASQGPAYVIQSTVQTPDGTRTVFLNVVSDLTGKVDIAEATEFNSFSRFKVYNGKIYVFDSENVEVVRFAVDENNDLVEEDKFSMAGLGVSGFFPSNAIVSEQYAVSIAGGIRKLVFWDPSSMEITGTIDYPDIIPESFRTGFGESIDEDGRVFFGYSGFDFDTFSNQPGVRLLIVDAVNQTLEPLFDKDIAAGTDGAVDGNGNYYHNADAYFGLARYHPAPENRETVQSIQRINRGENTFDPTFRVLASDITNEGYQQIAIDGFQIVGDRFAAVFLAASEEEILADPQAVFGGLPRKLYTGSTTDWKGVEIAFDDAEKTLNGVFTVDGEFYVVASNLANRGSTDFSNDLYRITTFNTLEKLSSTVGWLENFAKIR